jgi:hypothetical protein
MAEYSAVIAFPAMNVGIRTEDETLVGVRYLPRTAPLKAPRTALPSASCASSSATATIRTRRSSCR